MKGLLYIFFLVVAFSTNAQETYTTTYAFETKTFHLWTLMVDENGCLDNYSCQEIIRLSDGTTPLDFNIGDRWIYESEEYFGGGNSEISFKPYSIMDTVTNDGVKKYVLYELDTFYLDGSKMYFWDNKLEEYIMYFDFDNTSKYTIQYWDKALRKEQIATVVIDSISLFILDNDTIKVQHVNVLNSGTLENYIVDVYEGIGTNLYGNRFILGCGLCDNNPIITKLRCFSNDSISYNFVDYECDSKWLITSTEGVLNESITLSPNPTVKNIFIDGYNREINYEVYSVFGRLIQSGVTNNRTIELNQSGVLFVKLSIGGSYVIKRIVKMD